MKKIFALLMVIMSPLVIAEVDFNHELKIDLSKFDATSTSGISIEGQQIIFEGNVIGSILKNQYGLEIKTDLPDESFLNLTLTGSLESGYVTLYSAEKLKLTLEDAIIKSSNGPAINIQTSNKTFVELKGKTVLEDSAEYAPRLLEDGSKMDLKGAFFSEGTLVFTGAGELKVHSYKKHAIASDRYVQILSGTLNITTDEKDGIRTNDAFLMDTGTLNIYTTLGKAIKVDGKERKTGAMGYIIINGGDINIDSYDKAITASWKVEEDSETEDLSDNPNPYVTINGGNITIRTRGIPFETRTDSLSPEGIESKMDLTINGGTIIVNTTDDGLNAGTSININGGKIYANASRGDGIDSNGTITITGGLIVAIGPLRMEGGIDCDRNTFTLTGGLFVAAGGRNSTPTNATSEQSSVVLRNINPTLLVITDEQDRPIFSYRVPVLSGGVLLSSENILKGQNHKVYLGGEIGTDSDLFHGLSVDPTSYKLGELYRNYTQNNTVTTVN